MIEELLKHIENEDARWQFFSNETYNHTIDDIYNLLARFARAGGDTLIFTNDRCIGLKKGENIGEFALDPLLKMKEFEALQVIINIDPVVRKYISVKNESEGGVVFEVSYPEY